MKKYKLNIGIILGILLGMFVVMFPGCKGEGYSGELAAIDSLLQSDPDSAWQRLCDYDTLLLRSENDRHYYALLSAEANDKTFHEDTAENAISEAAAYFARKNDKRKAMRSMFYKGIAYQNSDNYGPAIITLLKSIEMSDTAEHLYRGKIYNALREVYRAVSDAPQELEYAQLSLEEYQKLDSLVFIEDLQLASGYALCRNNRFEEGINKMQQVYKAAKERDDEEMTEAALIYMALGYLWACDHNRAKDCFTIVYSNTEDKSTLDEYLSLYLNSLIYTESPADSIATLANVIVSDSYSKELSYEYYIYKKDFDTACKLLIEVLQQNDSFFAERLHSSVNHEIKSYMDKEHSKARLKISHLNTIITWIIISMVLLMCLILTIMWVYAVSKKKKEKDLLYSLELLTKEKSEILSRMHQLSSDNNNLNKEKSEITRRFDKLNTDYRSLSAENDTLKKEQVVPHNQLQNEQKERDSFGSDLLAKLFVELDTLHAEYYLHGNSEKGKTMLLNHLSDQLTLLREDKVILQNMEGHINNISDGILEDIYGVVKLNIQQRRIVALLWMGFSKEVVCQIMGIEMSSFYTRMNRLTKRIETSDSPRRNEFLIRIGRGKR